jgi:hypothetical protein
MAQWQEHFATVLGQTSAPVPDRAAEADGRCDTEAEERMPELDEPITLLEVKQAIRALRSGKAPGMDEISAEFLKTAEHIVSPFLT